MESKDLKTKVVGSVVEIDKGKLNASNAGKATSKQTKVVGSAMEIDPVKINPSKDGKASAPQVPQNKVVKSVKDKDEGNISSTNDATAATQQQPDVIVNHIDTSDDTNKEKVFVQQHAIERPHDPVNSVTKKKEIWSLLVRIDNMWIVSKGENEDTLELLLRDIKGDTIQATIMKDDIGTWKQRLSEGKTYSMRNFRVSQNDAAFKMSEHKFRLTFVGATRVDNVEIPGMPIHAFRFKDFAEILAGNFKPNLLYDAIGVVNTIGKIVNATPTRKGNVAFTMKDLRDNVIDCTLWDSLSVGFLNYYNLTNHNGRPVVLIIKHARVKEPQGSYPLQLTNVWNGTKLLFDPNVPEIQGFITSLPKNVTYLSQNISSSNSTQYYTQNYGASQFNSDEIFCNKARVITLGEMTKLKQDTICVTAVTTSHIRVTNQGWYFRGCHDCSCKADGNEPPFECKKGHKTDNPLIKYKLDVEVYDGDDSAKFVFWDNTLDELVGMTALTLLDKMKQIGLGDPQDYPKVLDDIMERKFAFRVKWTPGWGGQASVLQCKDSKELIQKIEEQLPVAESPIQDINVVDPIVEQVIPTDEPVQIQAFTKDDIDKFACLDDSMLSTPNVSVSSENEMPNSSHKTPAKRSAGKTQSIDSINLESQFSSTRSGKLIKKEKM